MTSIYGQLTNEHIASTHVAEVFDGHTAAVHTVDARLWKNLADGWDFYLAFHAAEKEWRRRCNKSRTFELRDWERRVESYSGWRAAIILGGQSWRLKRIVLGIHYIALTNEDGRIRNGGLLAGPFKHPTAEVRQLKKEIVRYYYFTLPPEAWAGLSIELVTIDYSYDLTGRLNDHPAISPSCEKALMSQFRPETLNRKGGSREKSTDRR